MPFRYASRHGAEYFQGQTAVSCAHSARASLAHGCNPQRLYFLQLIAAGIGQSMGVLYGARNS